MYVRTYVCGCRCTYVRMFVDVDVRTYVFKNTEIAKCGF